MGVKQLTWCEIASRFGATRNWWVCTTGDNGPHAVPVWGVVVDDVLSFYGSPTTVRSRNLASDSRLVIHLADGDAPLILFGHAVRAGLGKDHPEFVDAYHRKYDCQDDAAYLLDTEYAAGAVAFEIEPSNALAWTMTADPDDWTIRRWTAVG